MSPLQVGLQISKALAWNCTFLALPEVLEISSKCSNSMLERERVRRENTKGNQQSKHARKKKNQWTKGFALPAVKPFRQPQ